MGWLLLWTGIGIAWLAMVAGCGWRLWRKGRALLQELSHQGRTLGDLLTVLGELQLPATGKTGATAGPSRADGAGTPTMAGRPPRPQE
ncbi:hypothetical protein [Luteococcus sp. OSA5]|uniref:hypothetical protein n=1 Tax=Luteococcus sp. OSA5 TaxID=3401630 RepID=UPI003B434E07